MNIHRQLHQKRRLTVADFAQWLDLFTTTIQQNFIGPEADRAVIIANTIANNMQKSLCTVNF